MMHRPGSRKQCGRSVPATSDSRHPIVRLCPIRILALLVCFCQVRTLTSSQFAAPTGRHPATSGRSRSRCLILFGLRLTIQSKLPEEANTAIIWLSTLDGNRGGYETLISSGDLQLIKMDDLATQIQAYYARAEEISDTAKSHTAIRDRIFSSQNCLGSGFGQTSLEELIEIVRNDMQFASELSTFQFTAPFKLKP